MPGYEAVGQRQCHRRVVGPLARLKPKWTAAHHVRQRRLCIARVEFQRRPNRIADREAQQRADRAIRLDFGPDTHRIGDFGSSRRSI